MRPMMELKQTKLEQKLKIFDFAFSFFLYALFLEKLNSDRFNPCSPHCSWLGVIKIPTISPLALLLFTSRDRGHFEASER